MSRRLFSKCVMNFHLRVATTTVEKIFRLEKPTSHCRWMANRNFLTPAPKSSRVHLLKTLTFIRAGGQLIWRRWPKPSKRFSIFCGQPNFAATSDRPTSLKSHRSLPNFGRQSEKGDWPTTRRENDHKKFISQAGFFSSPLAEDEERKKKIWLFTMCILGSDRQECAISFKSHLTVISTASRFPSRVLIWKMPSCENDPTVWRAQRVNFSPFFLLGLGHTR